MKAPGGGFDLNANNYGWAIININVCRQVKIIFGVSSTIVGFRDFVIMSCFTADMFQETPCEERLLTACSP